VVSIAGAILEVDDRVRELIVRASAATS